MESKNKCKPMGKFSDNDINRLLSHLEIPDNWDDYETKCWECDLAQVKSGHCRFRLNGRIVMAHRLMCVYNYGYDPLDLETLHSCDTPKCCSPFHLTFGTGSQNTRDKVMRTCNHGTQKLTPEQVREIKQLLKDGNLLIKQIANQYDVERRTITEIKHGRNWRHIKI